MAYTYSKIATVTVGSGGASSINFLAIPQNYTDLVLKVSARTNNTGAGNAQVITLNSSSSSFSTRYLYGDSALAVSGSGTTGVGFLDGTTETANTFAVTDIYFPNYASSNYKSYSIENAMENNATSAYMIMYAGLWSNTSAINAISITPSPGSWVQYTTATLYGIKAEV